MRPENRKKLIQQFEDACRRHDLALTVQRRAIFETVLDRQDHPTADAVFERVRVRLPTISRTTVYRVLEALDRIGAVVKISHPGTPARYEPCISRHHHLVCRECDRLIDFDDANLDGIALPDVSRLGFEISDYCVQFRGVCATCRARAGGQGAGRRGKAADGAARQSHGNSRRRRRRGKRSTRGNSA